MNERIDELMIQAGIATKMNERIQELESLCWKEFSEEGRYYLVFETEKFAELIVRECVEWCDAYATIDGTAQQIRDAIKNHFGVE